MFRSGRAVSRSELLLESQLPVKRASRGSYGSYGSQPSTARRESKGRWGLGWLAALVAATIYAFFVAGNDGAPTRRVGRPVPRRDFWPPTGQGTDSNAAVFFLCSVSDLTPPFLTHP